MLLQATDGSSIPWDVIVFNEGLHSLWPRVNTTTELVTWTEQLFNWTKVLAQVRFNTLATVCRP